MRRITILLTTLLLCITLQAQDFGGSWGVNATENLDKDGTPPWGFGISLWKNAGKYVGDYSYITQYGNRIETGDIKIVSISKNIAKIQLLNTSDIGKKPKNCTIKLLPNGKLFFNYPNAKKDYALPDSLFMERTLTEEELIEIMKQ